MPVCTIVKVLPLGTVDDLMHSCTRLSASCNSPSGRPRHLGVIVLTILQTDLKQMYTSQNYVEINACATITNVKLVLILSIH